MTAFYKLCANLNGAIKRQQVSVITTYSKIVISVLEILAIENFIRSFTIVRDFNGRILHVEVYLAYHEGVPILKQLISVSKPGRRAYVTCDGVTMWRDKNIGSSKSTFLQNFRFTRMILSTSQGIMTENQAIKLHIGGEILCKFAI